MYGTNVVSFLLQNKEVFVGYRVATCHLNFLCFILVVWCLAG